MGPRHRVATALALALLACRTLPGCGGSRPAVRPATPSTPSRVDPGDDLRVRAPVVEGRAPSGRGGKTARGAEPSMD